MGSGTSSALPFNLSRGSRGKLRDPHARTAGLSGQPTAVGPGTSGTPTTNWFSS
jgi:hypothetical protein